MCCNSRLSGSVSRALADALSDRVIVIDNGRIIAADTPDRLKEQVSGDLVDLELADVEQVPLAAKQLDAHGSVETDGRHVRTRLPRAGAMVPALLRDLEAAGIALSTMAQLRAAKA